VLPVIHPILGVEVVMVAAIINSEIMRNWVMSVQTTRTVEAGRIYHLLLEIDPEKPGLEVLLVGRSSSRPGPYYQSVDIDLAKYGLMPDSGVSRNHMEIYPIKKQFMVLLHTVNRTYYEGLEIVPGKEYDLKDEGQLNVGRMLMTIRFTSLSGAKQFHLSVLSSPDQVDQLETPPPLLRSSMQDLFLELSRNTLYLLRLDALYTSLLMYVLTYNPEVKWESVVDASERRQVLSQIDNEISGLPEKYKQIFRDEAAFLEGLAARGEYRDAKERIEQVQAVIASYLSDGRQPPPEMTQRLLTFG
jgi:hypothetical protein